MKEIMNFIAMLYGIVFKLYDDCIDNKEAYSLLYDKKIILEVMLLVCTVYLLYMDQPYAMMLMITCIGMLIGDIIIYVLKHKYLENNLSYAYDNPFYLISAIFFVGMILWIHTFNLSIIDYALNLYIIIFIIIEGVYLFKPKKINRIESESGNIKLITRIICIVYAIMIYSIMLLNESFHKYLPVFYVSFSYGLTSIISILYLKYYYHMIDTDKTEDTKKDKIDIVDIINKMFSV